MWAWERFSEDELKEIYYNSEDSTDFAKKIGYKNRRVVFNIHKKYSWLVFSPLKDLTGKTFGKLTVLQRDDEYLGGNLKWICRCECGNVKSIFGCHLKSGKSLSCGKCIRSQGEEKISHLLSEMSISFETQKTFSDLKNKKPLRFDFFLPQENVVIEYNGKQHYEKIDYFGGEKGFLDTQLRDNIKKMYCYSNKKGYIEIPYTDYDFLSTEYLERRIYETSRK